MFVVKKILDNVTPYQPGTEESSILRRIYSDYEHARQLRDQQYREFDDMTPDEYWEQSRKRAKNYLPPLAVEQELSNIFFGKTRNKRNVIAAFVASQRPRVELDVRAGENTKKTDKRLAQMLTTAYDFFMDKEESDEKYLDWTIEALDVGTGHMQEDYDFLVRDVKVLKEEDHATSEVSYQKEERIERDQCTATIIPIEDVFIADFYQPDIQLQPYIIIREYIPRVIAQVRYGKYDAWKYVPYGNQTADKEEDTFFFQALGDRVEDDYVEVLHYYHKWDDLYLVTANAVLMTPDFENPIPYDHKKYPLAKNVYEKIGSNFYYGMSLPMKVVSEQDAFNESGNNNMDRSKISSIPTAIANYDTEIDQDYIGTYNILKVDAEANLRELQFQSVKPGDAQFMEFLGRMISEATIPDSFSGVVEGVTAAEIMNAKAQSQQTLGPFLTYIYAAAKNHAELRLANILQYFFMTSKKYNGKDFETREISVRTKLQDGRDGIRILRVLSNEDKKPPKEKRDKENKRGIIPIRDENGQVLRTEIETVYDYIYVTPQEISDIEYTITIIPGSSLPETQSLKKALALELASTMSNPLFAQRTDFGKLQKIIIEAFGYAMEDIELEQQQQPQAGAAGGAGDMQAMLQQLGGGGAPQQEVGQNSDLVQKMAGTSTAPLSNLVTG